MEMLRSFRGDKHEFCLAVIKSNILNVFSFSSIISIMRFLYFIF